MVIELRQYTCRNGRRDELIELFERELLETQEAVGIRVLGQFRDLDRPDRFVWLRGFRDLAARAPALHAFYDGPVWRAHRDAANATMLDSDDVLLLRPLRPDSGLPPRRAGAGGLIVATICERAADPDLVRGLEEALAPFAALETEPAPNDFPRLPVRSADVWVWLSYHDRSVGAGLPRPAQRLRLAPTARSRLR